MTKRILKANIPYIDGTAIKSRPVIEVTKPSDEHQNFQVIYITSQFPNGSYPTDITVSQEHVDFETTGLSRTSYIRCSKIYTIDPSLVESVIGDLPKDLSIKLDSVLKQHFKL